MFNKNSGFAGDFTNWLRGLCMGAADIVPGVSGGTMALILGHYQRLVNAISHLDGRFVALLVQRKFAAATEHADLRFLVALGLGMVSGIVALAALMHYLLENQMTYTYAVFTGLILVSSYLVARRLKTWSAKTFNWLVAGAVVAWLVCLQQPMAAELTPLSAFLSAIVAICAMILPGISGAFILLLLGIYHPVTELIKGLPKGDITVQGLTILAAFVAGCAFGLLAFSRILKWLLAHKHDNTLAFLCGLMLGSLYRIWPFQTVTEATAALPFKEQQFVHVWPSASPSNLPLAIGLAVVAAAATLLVEWLGSKVQFPRAAED